MESDAAGGGEPGSSELGRDRHANYTAVKNIKGCASHHLSTYQSKRMGSIVVTEDDSLDLDKYFGEVSKAIVADRGNDVCSNDVLDVEQRQGKSKNTTSFVTTQTPSGPSIRQCSSDGCINNSTPAMQGGCSPALTSYSEGCIPSPAPATVSTQQSSSCGSLRLDVYPIGNSPAQQYAPMTPTMAPPFHMPMAPLLVSSLPLGPWPPGRVGPGLNYTNAQQRQFNQSHVTTQYPPNNSIPIVHNQYPSQSQWTLHQQTSGQMGAAHTGIGMARGHQNGQNLNYFSQDDHPQPAPVNATSIKKRSTTAHHSNSNNNSNRWLEKDYKTGRTWTEDDHATTSSRIPPRSPNLSTIAERDDTLRNSGNLSSPQMDMIKTHHPHAKHHVSNRTGGDHNTTEEQPQLRQVNTSEKRTRSVTFGNVQVRTYETILTANPSCSSGPSLGIGWRYSLNHTDTSVASYESQQSKVYGNYRPSPEELLISRVERENILTKKLGYNSEDLAQSVRETTKMKNQRKQTVDNLKVSWFEERVEVCTRVLGRMLKKREHSTHMYEDWKGKVGQKQKASNKK